MTRWLRGGRCGRRGSGSVEPEPAGRLIGQVRRCLMRIAVGGAPDVKPANVLLDEDGNGYLGDFGIATRLTEDNERTPVSCLPPTLAPEELRGEPLSPRSDIYSLGCSPSSCFGDLAADGRRPSRGEQLRPASRPLTR